MSFSSKIKAELEAKGTGALSCPMRKLVRYSFIKWGTCNDPKKSYHMEFKPPSAENVQKLHEAFENYNIKLRKSKGENSRLYLKEAEQICDTLRIIGATNALTYFENIRIEKEIGGYINRKVNFETANIGKTVSASISQIRDIQFIAKQTGLDSLPEHLEIVARLRLTSPDATIEEIGKMIRPPVSKSGVNHRLRKIGTIAAKLRDSIEISDWK